VASQAVAQWRADLAKVNAKAAEALADPGQYSNLFRDWDLALQAEQLAMKEVKLSASQYLSVKDSLKADPLQRLRDGTADAPVAHTTEAAAATPPTSAAEEAVHEDFQEAEGGDEAEHSVAEQPPPPSPAAAHTVVDEPEEVSAAVEDDADENWGEE
jgi:coatomer subunit beta'